MVKCRQAVSKFTVPSAGIETAPEQLTTRKLHHEQPAAARVSNHFRGVGGTYATAADVEMSAGNGWDLD